MSMPDVILERGVTPIPSKRGFDFDFDFDFDEDVDVATTGSATFPLAVAENTVLLSSLLLSA